MFLLQNLLLLDCLILDDSLYCLAFTSLFLVVLLKVFFFDKSCFWMSFIRYFFNFPFATWIRILQFSHWVYLSQAHLKCNNLKWLGLVHSGWQCAIYTHILETVSSYLNLGAYCRAILSTLILQVFCLQSYALCLGGFVFFLLLLFTDDEFYAHIVAIHVEC